MISLVNLGKSFGGRTLFEGVTLNLSPPARYGLVGANGSGKTTLLRILAGDEAPSDGAATIAREARVGVLRQDRFLNPDLSILHVAMMGDGPVWAALEERERLVAGAHPDPARAAELEEYLAAHDGYTLAARTGAILAGLGIAPAVHERPLATLSGGFQLRVLLAQVLVGGPDVLLLDEPTNHLDILSIRWLEKFLAAYSGCAVVISHDQRFLDHVTTHILDVDYGTIERYVGNYSAFALEKQRVRAQKEQEVARAEATIAEKRAFVDRFGAKASKARQAQSRLRQIEKIEVEDLASSTRRAPLLRFVAARPSGRDVLELRGVGKQYGPQRVLSDVSLTVRRGEKVAVIGPNGLGKSTLLKIAVGRLAADAGTVSWGHETRVGYFAQDHKELLDDPDATPLRVLWAACPAESQTFVRAQLGHALFSRDAVEKPVGSLSGGEAARLVFSRIIIEKPNVLVLDEPTNHLDLESIQALTEGLRAFDGTTLFVSHDRWFVSALATRIIEVTPDGLRDFPGTYAEYLARLGDDHLDADAVSLRAKRERGDAPRSSGSGGEAWAEAKKRASRKRELPQKRDRALAAIAAAEARQKEIQALYGEDGFFARTSATALAALEAEEAALAPRIDALLTEWEALEAELQAIEE